MSGIIIRLFALASLVVIVSAMTVTKKESTGKNHELMSKLGLARRPVAPNHHRKRLASESRGSNADSHMFIIKLPPNQFYYSHYKPVHGGANALKKLPMGFRSNGKPGKIYHWNIPTLEKMADKRKHTSRLSDAANYVTKLKASSHWSASPKIDVHNKKTSPVQGYHTRKTQRIEKPILSYYMPASSGAKPRINKYFSGNGKPHSFYVIEKSKKPIKYHRLLS